MGKPLIHEAGHWTGLYHTFGGNCKKHGDWINDTPRQLEPSFDCRKVVDSCSKPKKSLKTTMIKTGNYMDYRHDNCMTEFTIDQITRMQSQMSIYRGVFV